jgi:hypothetical protein
MIEHPHPAIHHLQSNEHVGRITFLCAVNVLLLILSLLALVVIHANCEWHLNLGKQITMDECTDLREVWTFNAAICGLMLLLFPILYIIPALRHRQGVFANVHAIFTLVVVVLIGARIAMMVL